MQQNRVPVQPPPRVVAGSPAGPKKGPNPFVATGGGQAIPKQAPKQPQQPPVARNVNNQQHSPQPIAKNVGARPQLSAPAVPSSQAWAQLPQTAQGVAQLWQNNLTDFGDVPTEQRKEQVVAEQRQQAEALLAQVNGLGIGGKVEDNPELGLPTNLAGWADLLVEGSLLPKPGLIGPHTANMSPQQRQAFAQRFANAKIPPAAPAGGQGGPGAGGLVQLMQAMSLAGQQQQQQPRANGPPANATPGGGMGFFQAMGFGGQGGQLGGLDHLAKKNMLIQALANEPNQKWRQIRWCESPQQAMQLARQTRKPLFIEMIVGRLADKNSNMRTTALSDDLVIEMVNENFIPLALNVTNQGFPKDVIPALVHFESAYTSNWRFSFGFAGCGIVECDGQYPIGHSATARDSKTGVGFDRDNWVDFLMKSLERHERVLSIKAEFARGNLAGGFGGIGALIGEIQSDIQRHMAGAVAAQRGFDAVADEFQATS